jgi:hypothetical protein
MLAIAAVPPHRWQLNRSGTPTKRLFLLQGRTGKAILND